jgi:predicted RNA binding protein YcfA (HicA-like mRNA interferase family)
MVRLPRDVSGRRLMQALARLGYKRVSQKGSHVRMYTAEKGGNRVIVTDEKAIPIGTLHDTLGYIARHFDVSIEELLRLLEL